MRTRTEEQVRRWLKDHPEESLKILRDIEISHNGFHPQSDVNPREYQSRTTFLLENLLPLIEEIGVENNLNAFCENVIKCLNIGKCAVFILNRGLDELDIQGQKNWGKLLSVKIGHGIVGRSALLNKVVYLENPSKGRFLNLTS